jgi:hypothetical protein
MGSRIGLSLVWRSYFTFTFAVTCYRFVTKELHTGDEGSPGVLRFPHVRRRHPGSKWALRWSGVFGLKMPKKFARGIHPRYRAPSGFILTIAFSAVLRLRGLQLLAYRDLGDVLGLSVTG